MIDATQWRWMRRGMVSAIAVVAMAGQSTASAQNGERNRFRQIEFGGRGNLEIEHDTRITGIELRGGGVLVLRYGPTARFSVRGGDPRHTRASVDARDRLVIDACEEGNCHDLDLRIEVVTPIAIEGVAVDRGGIIRAEGRFPAQRSLAASVNRGGSIDVAAIDAGSVSASVVQGGKVAVRAGDALSASILRGGLITYVGDPKVASSVRGGGAVQRVSAQRAR